MVIFEVRLLLSLAIGSRPGYLLWYVTVYTCEKLVSLFCRLSLRHVRQNCGGMIYKMSLHALNVAKLVDQSNAIMHTGTKTFYLARLTAYVWLPISMEI